MNKVAFMLRGRRVADLQSCWGGCSAHSSVPPHHTLFVFSSPWGWDSDIIHHSVHKNSFVAVQDRPKRLIRQPEFAESAVLSWWLVWKRWVWTSPADPERRVARLSGGACRRGLRPPCWRMLLFSILQQMAHGQSFFTLFTDVCPRPCPQPSGGKL